MCAIFGYLGLLYNYQTLLENFIKMFHRGPENLFFGKLEKNITIGFHRLMINGLNFNDNQPLYIDNCILICNGEIYNYKLLIDKFNLNNKYLTQNDCEIIIHLYKLIGFKNMLKNLDGVFSLYLYDYNTKKSYLARDPIGIKPLFYNYTTNDLIFASEAKALLFINKNILIKQFPPGYGLIIDSSLININYHYINFYDNNYIINSNLIDEYEIINQIQILLINAVKKRLMSNRKIGCLLSGGIDSSIVASILSKFIKNKELKTYSIGLQNSVDLIWARKVAKYLNTNHYEICLTEEEFLHAIPETIYLIESYCTTTVRASVPNYLISKYIKSMSDDIVIFCGDVSDELFGSYLLMEEFNDPELFFKVNKDLLNNIHYFDVLRSDRCISGAGLEPRVPYADLDFVSYIMSLDPKWKIFNNEKIEKYYLRKAFQNYLPTDLLYRRKEAFSDGISPLNNSWFSIIQNYVNKNIQINNSYNIFSDPKPYDNESYWYRTIYENYFGKVNLIPHYWMQSYLTNNKDPSARNLVNYHNQ